MADNIGRKFRLIDTYINAYLNSDENPVTNLNPTHLQILTYVNRHENVIQKDLEEDTKLKKSSITGSLDALEKKGLIKRVQGKDDRRKNYIVLTKKAYRYQDEIVKKFARLDEIVAKGISEKELRQLEKTMDKIIENLKEYVE